MKWIKKGRICSHETVSSLPWYKKNTMVPVPYLLNKGTLRIFLTLCDEANIGRIGYIDVDPHNPGNIQGFSKEPVLNIGENGSFDDHGVVTASVLETGNELRLYYSGYQLSVSVPYYIFGGMAVSQDQGQSFNRPSRVPILDRTNSEIFSRCVPIVIKEKDVYKMWYLADFENGWVSNQGKLQPRYVTKYLTSADGVNWGNKEGEHCLKFENDQEHGLAKPTVWFEKDRYHMIYSIRHLIKGYRLGYASSSDGIHFERKDSQVGIDVSPDGWDSEMICFASIFKFEEKTYLFYCGNKYGLDGFGYAQLQK